MVPAGSSPLARGTLFYAHRGALFSRFIPARAGNTPLPRMRHERGAVHPRSRGEHPVDHQAACFAAGSSPLARGTPRGSSGRLLRRRFIPARAGNTDRPGTAGDPPAVHPRSRGEHRNRSDKTIPNPGSSPLARGTLMREHKKNKVQRFIPARAGNTRGPTREGRRRAVHPRSRGEHSIFNSRPYSSTGSSPLARGTPGRRAAHAHPRRFIPARAGNTRSNSC